MRMEPSSEGEAGDHYRHALQYNQKTLIGMRTINDLRTVLIACLLAFLSRALMIDQTWLLLTFEVDSSYWNNG
jgi:hypothetical protein